MRIDQSFSTQPATILVAAWNGVSSVILWTDLLTKVFGLISAMLAVACGAITLYGHWKKRRRKKGDEE